jgi:hypothetical protein
MGKVDLAPTKAEKATDVVAAITALTPWVGGAISSVISGYNTQRKLDRVVDFLVAFQGEIEESQQKTHNDYVRKEDFEDLLEEALSRAAREKNEQKRIHLAKFLANSLYMEKESDYDDSLKILKIIDDLEPKHILVLNALSQEPGEPENIISSSPIQTLANRLPDMEEATIEELIGDLNALRLTSLQQLKIMMTLHGALDLRGRITPLGDKLIFRLKD